MTQEFKDSIFKIINAIEVDSSYSMPFIPEKEIQFVCEKIIKTAAQESERVNAQLKADFEQKEKDFETILSSLSIKLELKEQQNYMLIQELESKKNDLADCEKMLKLKKAECLERDMIWLPAKDAEIEERDIKIKQLEQALETEAKLLTECLEAITKLRPNNAGLGVLQHKLKARLNKF